MAARRFRLPNIEELSKDQERVYLLPKEGCHLVVGGPGTGKSVIALLRARRHHQPKGPQDYVFLAYNHLLLTASRQLVGEKVNAHPWIEWFKWAYRQALGQSCPIIDGQSYSLNWPAIENAILPSSTEQRPAFTPPRTPYVIIDEGQDMPPSFYRALFEMGFANCFVVADQNQQIKEKEHSAIHEIAKALLVDFDKCIKLLDNWRNCDRVARLARYFCIDTPASPPVAIPQARPCAGTPWLIDYGDPPCRWNFRQVIERILKAADLRPDRLFGILTPNNECRERWFSALRGTPVDLDHGRPKVITYASGSNIDGIDFTDGGIFVFNAQSAKGLEFDTVVLADIDTYRCHIGNQPQTDALKQLFYVMISRAREQVYLVRRAGHHCPISAILPNDPNILQVWR